MKLVSSEIRHGVKYISRDSQPSMFDLIAWKEQINNHGIREQQSKIQNINQKNHRFTSPLVYQQPERSTQNQTIGQIPLLQTNPAIKHDLYSYDKDYQTKKPAYGTPNAVKKVDAKTNQLNIEAYIDEKQISKRKNNINKFNASTRELPNSAFTTYFGKPAFGNYGCAVDSKQIAHHKSHSVMPHAGLNHPTLTQQSHSGALNKANVINLQSYVPRKPIVKMFQNEPKVTIHEYYNVQISKPNLVHEVRFTNSKNVLNRKSNTPKHDDLNHLSKRKQALILKNKRQKGNRSKTEDKGDGLAYMNKRQNLQNVLRQKQKFRERIAYKPTQCYPFDSNSRQDTSSNQNKKITRAAGVSSLDSKKHFKYF